MDAAGADTDRSIKIRLRLSRVGALEVSWAALDRGAPEPVRLALDDVPVDPNDVFLFHKTTLRARYEDARARHPDADDAILVNTRGQVTETSVANIAARIEGRWWTPPLDAGLLPGTERAALLTEGALGERPISIDEARTADGLAVFSSVRGWRNAVLVGLEVGRRILDRERERVHPVFIHRTGAERASRRFLIDQHRALAERARALAHRQRWIHLFGHRLSARSGGAVLTIIGTLGNVLEPAGAREPNMRRGPPLGGPRLMVVW